MVDKRKIKKKINVWIANGAALDEVPTVVHFEEIPDSFEAVLIIPEPTIRVTESELRRVLINHFVHVDTVIEQLFKKD